MGISRFHIFDRFLLVDFVRRVRAIYALSDKKKPSVSFRRETIILSQSDIDWRI